MNEKSTAEGLPKPAKNSARALLASVVTAEISDMCTPRVKWPIRVIPKSGKVFFDTIRHLGWYKV